MKLLSASTLLLTLAPALAAQTKSENPAALKALFADLHKAVHGNDTATALRLTRGLLPDEARIRLALRPGVAPDLVAKLAASLRDRLPKTDAELARIFAPPADRTEVRVHAATTEELAAYRQGTPAWEHFPGGAQRAAAILKPGLTLYEVEMVKPGEARGTSYALIFFDGAQWTFLGRAWQVLPQ